jgi:hypothetical protein
MIEYADFEKEPSVCRAYTMASLGNEESQAGPGMIYKKYLPES